MLSMEKLWISFDTADVTTSSLEYKKLYNARTRCRRAYVSFFFPRILQPHHQQEQNQVLYILRLRYSLVDQKESAAKGKHDKTER